MMKLRNCRKHPVCLLLLLFAVSCSEGMLENEREIRTKTFGLVQQESDTKVVSTAGNNFAWSAGDPLKYYKLLSSGAASSTTTQPTTVDKAGASSNFEMVYTYPDDKELITVFLGSSLAGNTVQDLEKNKFTVTGGIPSTQDGTQLPYLVCVGKGNIETDQNLTMMHLQTFISFSLTSEQTKTGTYDKIVISDKKGTVDVAGNTTYAFADDGSLESCSVAGSGASKTITIDLPGGVEIGKTYYVAINPASFTNGLRIALQNGSTKLAYADTRTGNVLEKGKINELDVLDFHKTIPADADPVITPAQSSICNKGGFLMTKKLWATFSPEDCSGITWEIVKANNTSTTSTTATTTDPATIAASYGTITPGEKEVFNGVTQFTAIVTPKITTGWLLVKATLDGDEGHYATALVVVGDFIDIGGSVLWARSNLKGSYTSSTSKASLCTNTSDEGSFYKWGYLTIDDSQVIYTASDNYGYSRFGGTWSADGYTSYTGGTYSAADGVSQLKAADDVATKSNSAWHIPTYAEAKELRLSDGSNVSIKVVNGVPLVTMVSQYVTQGYGDMEVRFPINGCIYAGGGRYHTRGDMYVQTSTLMTATGSPYYGGNNYSRNAWTHEYVLCHATIGASLTRASGWGIRPVSTKSYPAVTYP